MQMQFAHQIIERVVNSCADRCTQCSGRILICETCDDTRDPDCPQCSGELQDCPVCCEGSNNLIEVPSNENPQELEF